MPQAHLLSASLQDTADVSVLNQYLGWPGKISHQKQPGGNVTSFRAEKGSPSFAASVVHSSFVNGTMHEPLSLIRRG